MKQLLPAAVLAIAIHGLLFIMDVPFSKRVPVKRVELKTLSVVLTREIAEKKPVPAPPPIVTPLMPPVPEPKRTVSPVLKPPPKPIHKRAEGKRPVPVKNKMPAPAPPPTHEAKPAPVEKAVAEILPPVPEVAAGKEEIKGTLTTGNHPPFLPNERSSAAAASGDDISVARPIYKKNPPPIYPNIARKRNAQGTVIILALVNEKGKVDEARVDTSSGYALLDEAALTAVKSWEFEPGRQGGHPVKSYVKLPITFQLN